MYQTDSIVMMKKVISARAVRKPASYHFTFSGPGGTSCVHGKMCPLPTRRLMSSSTSATGRKATYPSMKRMIGRDQRAVVMRCTATNTTPAEESDVKYSQLT